MKIFGRENNIYLACYLKKVSIFLILFLVYFSNANSSHFNEISKVDLPVSLMESILLVKKPENITRPKDIFKLSSGDFENLKTSKRMRDGFTIKDQWGLIKLKTKKETPSELVLSHMDQVNYIEYYVFDESQNLISSGKNGASLPIGQCSWKYIKI